MINCPGMPSPRLLSPWLDLVFPRGCGVCGMPLCERGIRLCAPCAAGLAASVGGEFCEVCGASVGPHLLSNGRCTSCQNARPPYDTLVRVGVYDHKLREMILRFKGGGRALLDVVLGDLLADAILASPRVGEVHLVTTIPARWPAILQRRYEPTAMIAQRVARRLRKPFVAVPRLTRHIREQKVLPLSERAANVRGAFSVRRGDRLAGLSICLVDDVLTSSSTMREAARALRAADAARVVAATLAVAEIDRDGV